MEEIKKSINENNKEIIKQLQGLYNKLSNNLDKSYYHGQKTAYEEMLIWLKNSKKLIIPPDEIKKYLIEKGAKSKNLLNEQKNSKNKNDSLKKTNKANFNYLYYNQIFNRDNNNNNNSNEFNVFPTSVKNAIQNNGNKTNNPFNFVFNNQIKDNEKEFIKTLKSDSSLQNGQNQIFDSFTHSMNNNLNNILAEEMKYQNSINNNFYFDMDLKRKK